jgi:NADPH:quinone reductase-like Zn-dependent oxidoreductase
MRAVAIQHRDEAPTVLELPDPTPGEGEIRVAVEAASINGFDAAVAAGYVWDALPHEFPVVLGRDYAGTVESLGAGVDGFTVGDRVAGVIPGVGLGPVGTLAELFTHSANLVSRVPSAVSSVEAAAVGLAGVTAVDLLDDLDVQADDVVLVSGATGGVGAIAVQLAVARGARVIATARPGEPADFAQRLGAAEVIDFTDDLEAAVRAVAPDGVTKIVHTAGDAGALSGLLKPGGHLSSALGAEPAQAKRDDVTISSIIAEATTEKLTSVLEAAASGQLTVPVSATYTLEQTAAALGDFGSGKLGKIVVTVR